MTTRALGSAQAMRSALAVQLPDEKLLISRGDFRHLAAKDRGTLALASVQFGLRKVTIQLLTHTPSWVYGLLAVLLVFGLRQTRDRNVGAVLAYLLPAGMVVLSLAGIQSCFGWNPGAIAMWALGLSVVALIGFLYFRDRRITFSPSTRSFFIPGSWVPFAVIMAIFFCKYGFAVARSFDAGVADSRVVVFALSLSFGCFSGYFAARAANLVARGRQVNAAWPLSPSPPENARSS